MLFRTEDGGRHGKHREFAGRTLMHGSCGITYRSTTCKSTSCLLLVCSTVHYQEAKSDKNKPGGRLTKGKRKKVTGRIRPR